MIRSCLCLLLLTVAPRAIAATYGDTWFKLGGPIGGLGYNVRLHPTNKNVLFVTDAFSGVQRSTDGGATWQAANTGIDARTGPSGDAIPVFSLTICEHSPNLVWVGTQGQRGVFKSTDGGLTYTRKDTGIAENAGLTIRNFEVDHLDTNTVYASGELSTGLQGQEFERVKGVVYRTINGGDSWTKVWESDSLARWLCAEKSTNLMLFTGIFDREAFNVTGEGVLRSTNGGTAWFNSNTGLTNAVARSLFVGGMGMRHGDATTVIVGTGNYAENNAGTFGGVFKSTNSGQSWFMVLPPQNTNSPGDPENVFTAVAFAPSNPDIVYVANAFAFYRSADEGLTWTRLSGANGAPYGPPGVRSGVPIEITVDPDDPDVVFVNNYGGGVFKSSDGAATWRVLGKGYTGANLYKVAASAQVRNVVLVNGRSGPFRSVNSGSDWSGVAFGEVAGPAEWQAAVIHPANTNILLVADEHLGKIFASTNGGLAWASVFSHPLVNPSLPSGRHGAKELVFAPSDPQILYAGFTAADFFFEPDALGFPASFGVYKSADGGLTWTGKNDGIPATNRNVLALAVSATNASVVFAGLRGGGVFKTTDGADAWTDTTANLPTRDIFALAVAPADANIIYAGTRTNGVWKSVNGGASWELVLDAQLAGGPPNKLILSIAIHPQTNSIVFVADHSSGVYRTTNAGATWQLVTTGLTTRAVTSLTFSGDGVYLFAATKGEGVFRLQTVPVPQRLAFPQKLAGGNFRLRFGEGDGVPLAGDDPRAFELQFTTDFATWTPLNGGFTLTNGQFLLDDAQSASQPRRYYRVIER